jgi:hypothetical protein
MPALLGDSPEGVFKRFRNHLGGLLNQTITDAPLSLIFLEGERDRAALSFRRYDEATSAPLRPSGLFLYVAQTVKADKDKGNWRLRTLQYSYWIQHQTNRDSCPVSAFRFEYISPRLKSIDRRPRHHLHIPGVEAVCRGRCLDLEDLHIPTGWVTVEEVIRFAIRELHCKPRSSNWDRLLLDSEEQFREWTSRAI